MDKIIATDNIFGALKLIEHLYIIGEVPGYVFRNIIQEYSDVINPADFKCHADDELKTENKKCMD